MNELEARIRSEIAFLRRTMRRAAVLAVALDHDPRTRGKQARDQYIQIRGLKRALSIVRAWAAESATAALTTNKEGNQP